MNAEVLGWNERFDQHYLQFANEGMTAARVSRQDRDSYVIYAGGRALRAAVTGAFRQRAQRRGDFPVVGDWIAVRPLQTEPRATIHAVLPRMTAISRKAAGRGVDEQPIAANVDLVLICCGADRDFNLRRVERYLALAYASGASPAILLTKIDLADDAQRKREALEEIALGAPVINIGAPEGVGVEEARRMIAVGRTAVLLGSSGVGKSTLINALLVRDEMRIGHVRAHDGRGRHTTTHRQMLRVPGGGLIIDTPGMRELQLSADSADVAAAFDEIGALAAKCRFRDCTHRQEPGCAVLDAVQRGELDVSRLEGYHKQNAELKYLERRGDPAAEAAQRAKWKAIHKAARKWMREKYRE